MRAKESSLIKSISPFTSTVVASLASAEKAAYRAKIATFGRSARNLSGGTTPSTAFKIGG